MTTPVMSSLAAATSPAAASRRCARLAERERVRMRRRLRTVAIVGMTLGLSACAADEAPDVGVPSVDLPDQVDDLLGRSGTPRGAGGH